MSKEKIYLDFSATAPVRPEVREAILPYLGEQFGNPSSVHQFGREAKKGLDRAREQVAAFIGADLDNVFFTSGGTESNNLAIMGAARFAKKKNKGNHLITTAIEHEAVLSPCRYLKENEDIELTVLPVDHYGRVTKEQVLDAVTDQTVLVSVMMANNEIGTLQPIEEIGKALREKEILFHTDAVQAVNTIEIDVKKLPVDLLSLSGHKIGALKGIGALYVRPRTHLHPLIFGGEQEMTLRSGTENVIGVISLGAAAELTEKDKKENIAQLKQLRDQLWEGIQKEIPDVALNGHPKNRLINNLSVSFNGAEGEATLLALDMDGIAASSGSACASGSVEPSHVLQAIGLSEDDSNSTVRFSLGYTTTQKEIETVLNKLPKLISRIRLANS